MTIALIGLRSGSKRIPHKNMIDLAGKPLCYWTLKHASKSKMIDKIYVLVDCKEYYKIVKRFRLKKVEVLMEKTIKEDGNVNLPYRFILDFPEIKFDILCLMQAPCPLFTDIDGALVNFTLSKKNSQLCVVRQKRLSWFNYGYPKNYKIYDRPKTQEIEGELIEVGCFYVTTKQNLEKNKNFLGGCIGLYEVPEYNFFEIDNELDYIVVKAINEKLGILK
jgi:CMP-N-acetylneuraminic acid synthetase